MGWTRRFRVRFSNEAKQKAGRYPDLSQSLTSAASTSVVSRRN